LTPALERCQAQGWMIRASYFGGKGGAGVAQQIINRMPPHTVYIEPFAGSGAVMRVKRPVLGVQTVLRFGSVRPGAVWQVAVAVGFGQARPGMAR